MGTTKHNFKIGDKVKVREPKYWKQGDEIGEVIEISALYIRVSWGGNRGVLYVPDEIYKVCVKGQQLLFDFMSGGSRKGD